MDMGKEVSGLTVRPDILVADATSLVYLVLAGQLSLLHEIGGAVFLVDVVAGEAAANLSWADAAALARWIAAGTGESSHLVRVTRTEMGQAMALARRSEPGFRAPRASEVAIREWLVTAIQDTVRPAIVLTENSRVPSIVASQAIRTNVSVVTTRALLALAEVQGHLASADTSWSVMLDRAAAALSSARCARLSQEQLDECERLIKAEVAARTPEQETAIMEALRDHGIEWVDE